jgi:hypothetical protein
LDETFSCGVFMGVNKKLKDKDKNILMKRG